MTIISKNTVALAMLSAVVATASLPAAAEPAISPVHAAAVKPTPPPALDKDAFRQAIDASSQDPSFLKALVTGDQAQLTRIVRKTCAGVPVKGAAGRCSLPGDVAVKVQPIGPVEYLICLKPHFDYWCHTYDIKYMLIFRME